MSATVPDFFFDFEHHTFDQLDRILPIGASRQLGDMQLTLLSLECYQAGFVALTVFEQGHPPIPDPPPPADAWEPPLLLRATPVFSDIHDDLGNRYNVRIRAGAGGSIDRERIGTRFVHALAPALDPAAQSLTLTVTQIAPLKYDDDGAPIRDDSNTVDGPWTVSFALQPASEVSS